MVNLDKPCPECYETIPHFHAQTVVDPSSGGTYIVITVKGVEVDRWLSEDG